MPQEIIRRRMSLEQLTRGSDGLPPQARVIGQIESFVLASGVLRAFLDPVWVEKHIVSDNVKRGFLSIDETDPYRQEMSKGGKRKRCGEAAPQTGGRRRDPGSKRL
jgi:hypothetical protein